MVGSSNRTPVAATSRRCGRYELTDHEALALSSVLVVVGGFGAMLVPR